MLQDDAAQLQAGLDSQHLMTMATCARACLRPVCPLRVIHDTTCAAAVQVKVVASRSCSAGLVSARQVQRGCVSTVVGRCQQVRGASAITLLLLLLQLPVWFTVQPSVTPAQS